MESHQHRGVWKAGAFGLLCLRIMVVSMNFLLLLGTMSSHRGKSRWHEFTTFLQKTHCVGDMLSALGSHPKTFYTVRT